MKTRCPYFESELPTTSCHAARFLPGGIYITPSASEVLTQHDVLLALSRHLRGDWGDVSNDDAQENDRAVRQALRVLSAYRSSKDVKFLVITEEDRVATTIQLPEED